MRIQPRQADSEFLRIKTGLKKTWSQRIQGGSYREEAESVLPKVKSWRDPGDKQYRKNH
jgi:hypothetical protein